jgi:hypothetical protein
MHAPRPRPAGKIAAPPSPAALPAKESVYAERSDER